MKLCLILGTPFESLAYIPIIKILKKKHDLDVDIISLSKYAYDGFIKQGINAYYIFRDFDRYHLPMNVEEELIKIENKYNIDSINLLIVGDPTYSKIKDTKKLYPIVYKYFKFWEDYLDKNKPDYIVGGPDRLYHEIALAIAHNKRIPYYSANLIALTGDDFSLMRVSGRDFDHDPNIVKYWKENKDRRLSSSELTAAKRYVSNQRQTAPSSYVFDSVPKLSFKKIRYFLKVIHTVLFIEKNKFPSANITDGLVKFILKFVRTFICWFIYSTPKKSDKIIFFPLQDTTDGHILVNAPQYKDQFSLIEVVANSIPIGYTLYIKEHPAQIGGFSLRSLFKIMKLRNVKIITPNFRAKSLIKMSKGVITVNSTVGWEGVILGKPVICLGDTFYEISGLCYSVRDLYQLAPIIKKAIKFNPVKDEYLFRFVNALFKICRYKVKMLYMNLFLLNKEMVTEDEFYTKENLETVAEIIYSPVNNKEIKNR